MEVDRAPGRGAAVATHRLRPGLDEAGADPGLGVDGEVFLVMDIGVVQLQLSAGLSVELNPLAAAEPGQKEGKNW